MYPIWAEIWNFLNFFVAFLSPRDFISAGDIPINVVQLLCGLACIVVDPSAGHGE